MRAIYLLMPFLALSSCYTPAFVTRVATSGTEKRRAHTRRAVQTWTMGLGMEEGVAKPTRSGAVVPEMPQRVSGSYLFGRESVEQALDALRSAKPIVVVEDDLPGSKAAIIAAAENLTPEIVELIRQHTTDGISVSMEQDRLQMAELPHLTSNFQNLPQRRPSDDLSASDAASALRSLAAEDIGAAPNFRSDLLVPLCSREGGVLKRAGHTEAAVDFCRSAGLPAVGVLGAIGNAEARELADSQGVALTSIEDLIAYRWRTEQLVEKASPATRMPTKFGHFMATVYTSQLDGIEHMALSRGDITADEPVLVRVHSECCTGDIFGSLRCDCGIQLEYALETIEKEGRGILLYLRGQEGRGIGLACKIRAYALQDQGLDTVEANEEQGLPVDSREYGIGAQILAHMGVTKMKLMTNNPHKYTGLAGYGLSITERVPTIVAPNPENIKYLRTKQERMGHVFDGEHMEKISLMEEQAP